MRLNVLALTTKILGKLFGSMWELCKWKIWSGREMVNFWVPWTCKCFKTKLSRSTHVNSFYIWKCVKSCQNDKNNVCAILARSSWRGVLRMRKVLSEKYDILHFQRTLEGIYNPFSLCDISVWNPENLLRTVRSNLWALFSSQKVLKSSINCWISKLCSFGTRDRKFTFKTVLESLDAILFEYYYLVNIYATGVDQKCGNVRQWKWKALIAKIKGSVELGNKCWPKLFLWKDAPYRVLSERLSLQHHICNTAD